jgi:hypothetical protein
MWTLVELQPGLMVLLKGSVHAGFETRHIMHRHTDTQTDGITGTHTHKLFVNTADIGHIVGQLII